VNPFEADYQIRGWRSLYYGQKDPALSLALETKGLLPVRFVTVLAPSVVKVIGVGNGAVEIDSNRGIPSTLGSSRFRTDLPVKPAAA